MAILWIDIETIPGCDLPDIESIKAPGNYKDPEKIRAYQEEKRQEAWEEQALDSMRGNILCVSWAIGSTPTKCYGVWEMDEREVIEKLEKDVGELALDEGSVTWGGFNVSPFDLQWIYHRALKYNLPFLIEHIQRKRYPTNVLDVRNFWTGGDPYGKGRLKDIAKYLRVETIGIDGSQVLDLWLNGEYETIREYCMDDVNCTRNIAWMMGIAPNPVWIDTRINDGQ